MPTPTKGPRLGGGPAHERLLLANLAAALFTHKSINTTETKPKRLRPLAARLITFETQCDLHNRRRALAIIGDKTVIHELFTEIAPLVEHREGGYTRITKLGFRKGDNASMVQIELVLEPVNPKPKSAKKTAAADAKASGKSDEKPAKAAAPAEAELEATPDEDNGPVDENPTTVETIEVEVPAEDTAADAAAVAADAEESSEDDKK